MSNLDIQRVKIYKKMAVSFVILTLFLLFIIIFFSLGKVKIIIQPEKQTILQKFIVTINPNIFETNYNDYDIPGKIIRVKKTLTKRFKATGFKTTNQKVEAQVDFYNNYSRSQPLVKTTRLLDSKGELFCLEKTVRIPAGGKLEGVSACKGELRNGVCSCLENVKNFKNNYTKDVKFTIPGLWKGLQNDIYAKLSKIDITGNKISIITEKDINQAKQELKKEVLSNTKQELEKEINFPIKMYFIDRYEQGKDSVKFDTQVKPGEQKENFDIGITANIIGVGFNENNLLELAKDYLSSNLENGEELTDFSSKGVRFEFNKYNQSEKTVNLKVTAQANILINKINKKIIDKDKILGKKIKETKEFLNSLPQIKTVEIKQWPSWLDRIPSVKDRVEIEIKQ